MSRKQHRDAHGRFVAGGEPGPGRRHRLSDEELLAYDDAFRRALAEAKEFLQEGGHAPYSISQVCQLLPQCEGEHLLWLFQRAMLARHVATARLKDAARRAGLDPDEVIARSETILRADFRDLEASGRSFDAPQSTETSAKP